MKDEKYLKEEITEEDWKKADRLICPHMCFSDSLKIGWRIEPIGVGKWLTKIKNPCLNCNESCKEAGEKFDEQDRLIFIGDLENER